LLTDNQTVGWLAPNRINGKRKGFRWCKVGEYDPIPCGGVHTKNTKEIEKLSCKERLVESGKQKIVVELS